MAERDRRPPTPRVWLHSFRSLGAKMAAHRSTEHHHWGMSELTRHRVNGISLAVMSRTSARPRRPAVVLLPATGATAADWDLIAEELSRDRTVHGVDLRGHGASEWPGRYSIDLMAHDLRELLPTLGAGAQVDLIGHSLGGLVACRAVAGDAAVVRRLVLEDVGVPHPRASVVPDRPDGELEFDWAVVEQVRPEIDQPSVHWSGTLAGLTVPTLAISGGPSSFLPQEHVIELVALAQRGSLATIDAGHCIHATKPGEFVRTVRTFLDA